MKTLKNGKSAEGTPVFVTLDRVTYMLCDFCRKPMYDRNVTMWQQDKDGNTYNVNLVHYKCQESFVIRHGHDGLWFSRGMTSVKIEW